MASLDSEVHWFVAEHPNGWSHSDWERLLADLSAKRIDVADVAQVGVRLEAERLRQCLLTSGVSGLGPRRVDAIVEKFGSVANLRNSGAERIAEIPTIPRRMAEET